MNIKSLIEKSDLTRIQICEQVGMSPSYLSLIESGKRKVGQAHAQALAECLGVTVMQLRPDWAARILHVSSEN